MARTLGPVHIALLVAIALPASAPASTMGGSSWGGSQPSWAANEPDATPTPTSRRKRDRNSSSQEISPFSPGSNNISLDVGQVFLMGNLANTYQSSIGTQVHYNYGVSDLFGFDATAGYSEHSNGAFSLISAMMGVRANLAWYDRVIPYAVFGMGFYKPNYQIAATGANGAVIPGQVSSVSPLLFGVHLGPGVNLALTKQIFFGAQLTFNDIFGDTEMVNNQPFSTGGTYTTFFVSAGVTF